MARKTEFELTRYFRNAKGEYKPQKWGKIYIVPERVARSGRKLKPKIIIRCGMLDESEMEGRDLERFAVNILKALNSKKLK